MADQKIAVIGIGATGSVLAGALLGKYPDTVLVGHRPEQGAALKKEGINISGAFNLKTPVRHVVDRIGALRGFDPTLVFIATKTFHLMTVLREMKEIYQAGMKIVSTQNGLGVEDLVSERFGDDAVFRMSLNYGVSLKGPGDATVTFFNRPNHLGGFTQENRGLGLRIAEMLTGCGLDTTFVDDIKEYVWKKMIMKCTMASICAVTNLTIKEALNFGPTREIADACFQEARAVAKGVGYDFGESYLKEAFGYLNRVGFHKDSMCHDIENKKPTEIDFLGGKIVAYGREKGIPTPFLVTMTNLVKTFENRYCRV